MVLEALVSNIEGIKNVVLLTNEIDTDRELVISDVGGNSAILYKSVNIKTEQNIIDSIFLAKKKYIKTLL